MKFFSIPEPCSENWSEMSATEKGAFCQKCSKEVQDVSRMTNPEIMQLIATKKETPCMRITRQQEASINLQLSSAYNSQKRNMQRAMLFSLLVVFGFTLFSCNSPQQIHERNLLESVAESMIDINDAVNLGVSEVSNSSIIENTTVTTTVSNQTIPPPVLNEIDETIFLLGEPALEEEVKVLDTINLEEVNIDEMYVTMGVVAFNERLPSIDYYSAEEEGADQNNSAESTFTALAFPNPATTSTQLEVELPVDADFLEIRLLDLNGRVLKNVHDAPLATGKHQFRLDLSSLKPAYYLIDVRSNNQHEVVRLSKI